MEDGRAGDLESSATATATANANAIYLVSPSLLFIAFCLLSYSFFCDFAYELLFYYLFEWYIGPGDPIGMCHSIR